MFQQKIKFQIDFKYKAAAISSTNKNYSNVLLFLKQAWSHDYIKDTDVRGFFNFQIDMQTKYYSSGVQVKENYMTFVERPLKSCNPF